jgi:hypothetical protein
LDGADVVLQLFVHENETAMRKVLVNLIGFNAEAGFSTAQRVYKEVPK